jgi:hypothetical protein
MVNPKVLCCSCPNEATTFCPPLCDKCRDLLGVNTGDEDMTQCIECGKVFKETLAAYTPINRVGAYCNECIDEAKKQEAEAQKEPATGKGGLRTTKPKWEVF